jgi:hypothetical protein
MAARCSLFPLRVSTVQLGKNPCWAASEFGREEADTVSADGKTLTNNRTDTSSAGEGAKSEVTETRGGGGTCRRAGGLTGEPIELMKLNVHHCWEADIATLQALMSASVKFADSFDRPFWRLAALSGTPRCRELPGGVRRVLFSLDGCAPDCTPRCTPSI